MCVFLLLFGPMRFMGVVESQLRLEAFVRIVKYVGKMQVSGFDCKSVPGVPVLGDIVGICAILRLVAPPTKRWQHHS